VARAAGRPRRASPHRPPLLCLPIRNTVPGATGRRCPRLFALLTDTQRPLRIGKQSKAAREVALAGCLASVAYR